MTMPLRVLIIEDSQDKLLELVTWMREGGFDPTYTRVVSPEDLQQVLSDESWDIVLADVDVPHLRASEALRIIKSRNLKIPFLLLIDTMTAQQAAEVMREGANDYILKTDLSRLIPAMQRELREVRLHTELREALAALRASEMRYRTLFTVEPDALLLLNADTLQIVDANEAAQQLLGYTLEEFRTKTLLELSAEPEKTATAIKATQTTETFTAQRNYHDKAGKLIPVELAERRFILEEQAYIFLSLRNIAEHLHAREALEREQAFLSSSIELLPFPIIFNTPTGEVLRANRASYDFFADLSLTNWWNRQLLDPETRQPISRECWPMMIAAQGKVVPPTEAIFQLPNGREVDVLAVAAPITVWNTLVATVVAFMDITPIKEAGRAKTRFLALLSHQLRTPLTNILGWAQEAQELPEIVPEALRIIQRNAEEQRRMLENLLEVSRYLHNTLELQRVPSDLWTLVEKTVQNMLPEANERKVTIQQQPPEQPLPVNIDRKRISEVLVNILDNAIRFSGAGSRITVHGFRKGNMAMITVEDTGAGISSDVLSHIFEFFHFSPGVQQTGEGLGLSLPLAKVILEQHGGSITITSAGVGHGTTVTIAIPVEEHA